MSRWADQADDSDDELPPQRDDPSPSLGGGLGEEDISGVSGSGEKTSSGLSIPPTQTSRVDSKGIKIVTSYKANPGNPNQLLKTITKIRVTNDKIRENVAVQGRRKWKKFGQAALTNDDSNVTIQSRDDVFVEDPNADVDLQDEDPAKALAGNLNAFWQKQQRRQLERKYDVDAGDMEGGGGGASGGGGAGGEGADGPPKTSGLQRPPPADSDAADGWTTVSGTKGGGGGGGGGVQKYVPPSHRSAAGGGGGGGGSLAAMAAAGPSDGGRGGRRFDDSNRDQNTIRVTNISEDTTESDLQDLFQPFGRISRVYLAKDKETMVSRGFAFVSFVHREDAARAMEKLQGFGYDHLILKLEWARPSAPKDPGAETTYRTGYGKALAQDTKEKVTFASNLTTGVRT